MSVMGPELSCAELVELVSDYLDRHLPLEDVARFDLHLARCAHCVEYVDQMRRSLRLASRLREIDAPAVVRARPMAAFRDWLSSGR